MGIKGFDGNLSEESKKALQSEMWQKVRDSMKGEKEVKHFTAESTAENAYDLVVEQTEEDPADGEAPQTERAEEGEPDRASDVIGENIESEQEPRELVENKAANKQESRIAKQLAEEKLKKELAAAKDRSFADPIIGYLLERCREDEGLAEDVAQEHKTWQKCFDYIYSQARKRARGNCAAVRDDMVYEWAEDYYHKDDKAEEGKKVKKSAEDKAKREKSAAEREKTKTKGNTDKAEKVSASSKSEVPKESPKPKKNGKEMNGQLDLFAMMGM